MDIMRFCIARKERVRPRTLNMSAFFHSSCRLERYSGVRTMDGYGEQWEGGIIEMLSESSRTAF
ncbi:hypothetical protein LguiA_032648 [Lonicera macranthoides]